MTSPTIYDIASKAGVGIATVSRVINGGARVAAPTRDAVRKAMDELGFRPNRAARRLASGGANRPRVAALMPFFSTNFYVSVTRPMAQGLAAVDTDFVLYDIPDRDTKNRLLDRIAAERSAEGLIICSMGVGPERQAQFKDLGIPLIIVDFPLPGVPTVTVDNLGGARMATEALRVRGAKRLALINGPVAAVAFRDREAGFTAAAGPAAPIIRCDTVNHEAGRWAIDTLLAGHPQVDGIVCVNDLLAVGAVDRLRTLGRKVPEQVQVVGFDDMPLMDVLGISTVRQPMLAFGEWAARTIHALIQDPRSPVESLELSLSLVERATTRARPTPPSTTTRPKPKAAKEHA